MELGAKGTDTINRAAGASPGQDGTTLRSGKHDTVGPEPFRVSAPYSD